MVSRNKRRYGGYIVHLGIVLIFFGFAGRGFELEEQVRLLPGQQTTIGEYTVRHDALKISDDGQKQMVTAHLTLFKDGQQIDRLYPAKWFFRKHEGQPTTEAAIRRTMAEDFYVVLGGYEPEIQAVNLQLNVNPLVDWVWLGFGIMAIGTGIAVLPETAFSFALSRLPATSGATATTALLLLLTLLPIARLSAQGGEHVQPIPMKPLEAELQGQIMCLCGGCRAPLNDCPMQFCHSKVPQKEKLHEYVEQGQSRDQIIAAFVKDYGGQDVLAAPINKGFNRLAWLFPYLVGAGSAVIVGVAAVRFSRRREPSDSAPVTEDPALAERLDDELRDLD
jgi:cytochrome c-type biogenesis protein CcmF